MTGILPGTPFPHFDVARLGGGRIDNSIFAEADMTVLNVYRGLHCPRCKAQIADFTAHEAELAEAGMRVVSISTDSEDRAEQVSKEWEVGSMPIGYGLTEADARRLGCYISETIREAEPERFAEAALFMVQRDGTLWGAVINTFPFIRPTAAQLLDAMGTRRDRSYPPRGNVAA